MPVVLSSPVPTISQKGIDSLKTIIDKAVSNPTEALPGTSVSITNSQGADLFTYASGFTSADQQTPITDDNLFWIASCTKQIATIGILQLVEQGILRLDDSEQVEQLVPELSKLPIATRNSDGSIKLTPKVNKITLRHLLTHTAGFSYTFFNDIYRDYGELFSVDEFDVANEHQILFPLVFEPGTNWEYGTNIDWAGTVLERATGKRLGEYIDEYVLKPLGVKDTSFTPDAELRKKLVGLNFRDNKTGKLSPIDHVFKKAVLGEFSKFYHSGGAGLFSKPKEYVKVLSTLLNDGLSPLTGNRVLKKETVDLIFTNQIPQFPNFGRKGIPDSIPFYTNPIPDIYPQGTAPQGWGLSLFLTLEEGATGRGKNTGFWCGLANLFYWVDREKGIAGFVATEILPFADVKALTLWFEVETAVYSNLQ